MSLKFDRRIDEVMRMDLIRLRKLNKDCYIGNSHSSKLFQVENKKLMYSMFVNISDSAYIKHCNGINRINAVHMEIDWTTHDLMYDRFYLSLTAGNSHKFIFLKSFSDQLLTLSVELLSKISVAVLKRRNEIREP